MSSGWSWFVAIVSIANIVGVLWLLWANGRGQDPAQAAEMHVWDGDLTELNNPLPRWWFWLFVGTVVFAIAYLVLYPGLGNFQGTRGWTQEGQHAREVALEAGRQAPRYARFRSMALAELSDDPDAMATARNVFVNGCAGCHGSDGRGAPGFPDLTDSDWLYGNEPDVLLATIGQGRTGVMPPWGPALGDAGVTEVAAYLRSLTDPARRSPAADAGAAKYAQFCVACHGADARGNRILGAPNLADRVWLHGGDDASIRQSIADGRTNEMPPHQGLLGEDRVRLMAAYVLSLAASPELPANSEQAGDAPGATEGDRAPPVSAGAEVGNEDKADGREDG